jgi:hypothetical protein
MTDLSTAPRAFLFTPFGNAFHIDASGELRHGASEESPPNAALVAAPSPDGAGRWGRITYLSDGTYRPIVCRMEESRLAAGPQVGDGGETLLELVPLERGLLGLRAGGLFLCGEPDGRLTLSRTVCSLWECFLASEDWCTAPQAGDEHGRGGGDGSIDWRRIAAFIIDPGQRAQTRRAAAKKFLVFGYTQWSHGRVYYDLCKLLHDRGYVVDILDWRALHSAEQFARLLSYYDFVISALDGVQVLVDAYGVPYERIVALSHGEMDLHILIDQKGREAFDRFAAYGAVGFNLYVRSALLGVAREPLVVPLGINYQEFCAEIPDRLATVGYASSMTQRTIHGVEIKRGELAEAAARDAGLAFKVAGSTAQQTTFHDMPAFYKSVDAVVMASVTEGDPLPVREAAAAGRLVIGTPAGHFPLRAYGGGGIIAPIEREKFKAFTTAALAYYKENPEAYVAMCREIQEAARQFDWEYAIGSWVELLESAERRS